MTTAEPGTADAPSPGPAATADPADPADQVAGLAGDVPVTLLPVRLETRYGADRTELRIRIFPEQIHIDNHQPKLTAAENEAGRQYWLDRWVATGPDEIAAAWLALTEQIDPPRARWVAQVRTPTNVGDLGTPGVQPQFEEPVYAHGAPAPVARLLPGRWVAIGYQAGAEVFRVWGEPVADQLVVGLSTEPSDGTPPPDGDAGGLPIDGELRWLADYGEAVRVGMAVTVRDDQLASGTLAGGLSQLVVLGVSAETDPAVASAEVTAQLDRLAVSDGLAVLGLGTPTNNTDAERSAPGSDPALDPAAYDPATPPAHEAGARLGAALAAPGAAGLLDAPGTHSLDPDVEGDLHWLLWPATFAAFSEEFLRNHVSPAQAAEMREHARRALRAGGPFAALRVGDQPYGVLPALSAPVAADLGTVTGLSAYVQDFVRRLYDDRPARLFHFHWGPVDAHPLGPLPASDDPEGELLELLRRTPSSQYYRYRPMLSVGADDIPELVTQISAEFGGQIDEINAHWSTPSSGSFTSANFIPHDPSDTQLDGNDAAELGYRRSALLPVPLVSFDEPPVDEPVGAAGYLTTIADLVVGGDAALAELDAPPTGPRSLLEALLRYSASLEIRGGGEVGRFREGLLRLAAVPLADLHRHAAYALDAAAHRLDAWVTSFATAQLQVIRDTQPGSFVGGFGYVEDLEPAERPASDGFIHAPSVNHAATAAILRSGHLARRDDGEGLLAIDLTSGRVNRGLEIMEGIGTGQPVGALLGYRFERGLRDRDVTLARYLLPFRLALPLPSAPTGPIGDGGNPVEAVAARDVVDGLALVERWKADRAALYAEVGVAEADRAAVDAVVAGIDDALDAVSDLLVAEGVHQIVVGNPERSAAALDALDRQEAIPDVGFVRTPHSGIGYEHRLAILSGMSVPAPGWEGIDDPRRRAEPRLDHWIGTVLGRPDRYVVAADAVDDGGVPVETVSASLADLGISAISTVMATATAGTGGSELEIRVAAHLGSLVTAAGAARLVLSSAPPAGAEPASLGLGQLLDLGARLVDLVGAARPADFRDLMLDVDPTSPAADLPELRARADAALDTLRTVHQALDAAGPDPDPAVTAGLVRQLADAGQPAALAGTAGLGTEAGILAGRIGAVEALDAAFDRSAATEDDLADHDRGRIQAVFGDAFPAVPLFLDDPADLVASIAHGGLLAGDPLAPATWLTGHGRVRPAVGRLVSVLETSEGYEAGPGLDQLTVTQLPVVEGDRWIGREWDPPDVPPAGRLSLVAHLAPGTEWLAPMAGLVIDQWTETVPRREETTGLTVHYDAPGARAPQVALVAVPSDRTSPSWTLDGLIFAVRETMELARYRAHDLDDLAVPRSAAPCLDLAVPRDPPGANVDVPALIAAARAADPTPGGATS